MYRLQSEQTIINVIRETFAKEMLQILGNVALRIKGLFFSYCAS